MAKPNNKERNLFEEIDLKIMLINERIKNHRRSIEKAKKDCGWYGPSGVGGVDYSKEPTNSVHISFIDGLQMIELDESRIRDLEEERKELRRSKCRIKRIYGSLAGTEAQIYYWRIIQGLTQAAAAEKIPISVRQLQRIESDMKDKGLL